MSISINDNLSTSSPKPLDDRYGTYTSTTEANTAILSAYRYIGLTVGIITGGTLYEYWYYTGTTNPDLVLKTTGGGGGPGTSGISGLSGLSGISGTAGSGSGSVNDCYLYTITFFCTVNYGWRDCDGVDNGAVAVSGDTVNICAKRGSVIYQIDFACPDPAYTELQGDVCATTCQNDYMLIASHSGSFATTTTGNPDYYCGNEYCGWDSCDLNVTYDIKRGDLEGDTAPQYANCGIPLPIDLIPGDVLELCGHAWAGDAIDGDLFLSALMHFSCDNVTTGDSKSFITDLIMTPSIDYFENNFVCFKNSVTVGANGYTSCDNYFMVGMATDLYSYGSPSLVKFTWTLKVLRNCFQGGTCAVAYLTKGGQDNTDACNDIANIIKVYYPNGQQWAQGWPNSITNFYTDCTFNTPFAGGGSSYNSNINFTNEVLEISNSGVVASSAGCP
jgi:hypothetical protein